MKLNLLLLLLIAFMAMPAIGQVIPFVYDVENTGAECADPVLPEFADLPIVEPLTDPFEWSDGSGRVSNFEDWSCRRAEIKAEFEEYEIGIKPDRPEDITASYVDGVLTVNITVNDSTLTLTSNITLPDGTGPFPAVIGMGGGSGSLPADIFASRDIARIPFNYGQVMAHTQTRGSEPINRLYPDLTYMGAYSAWSWGVSRLIDGLELVAADLPVDLSHLAVTGCSFAGKMALFAGAFDERIALTIAQESGGGGAAAWRVSETIGNVEVLGATNGAWFIGDMFKFGGANVTKLPMDHHELMTMIAPRALLVLGNPDFEWLADPSGYVSCRAAHEVWKEFEISDRFGFSIVGGHGHCALPEVQMPEVEAFVEKFLLDNASANTDVTIHSYPNIDYKRWYSWWGSGEPVFAVRDYGLVYDAECTAYGENWKIGQLGASNPVFFATANDDLESISDAPASSEDHLSFTFNIEKDTTYKILGRLNCVSSSGDSYWMKIDDDPFVKYDGLLTNGWEWKLFDSFDLSVGEHTITLAFCENGAKIDRFCISKSPFNIEGNGGDSENACVVGVEELESSGTFMLGQNFPNPFNGISTISFEITDNSYVSLKVYSPLGQEIKELAGKNYATGIHTVEFDASDLSEGTYFYTLKSGQFIATRKMVLMN